MTNPIAHSAAFAHDSRTGLPDRDCFYRDVAPHVQDANTGGTAVALLDIDIQGVDFVLRTFGPTERDNLVTQLGRRIGDARGRSAAAYHITQDRFAIVLRGRTFRQATKHAQQVMHILGRPFEVTGVPYHLECHIGISHCPNHADSVGELVRASVFACHQARLSQLPYAIFDRGWDERERHRFRLMLDLERALERTDEIRLAYQPVIELDSGRCVGIEALCRWQHPSLGTIPPGEFLPFVENSALMLPLTEVTIDCAMRDQAAWLATGFDGSIAINLSTALFRHGDFLERLYEHARFANMRLDRLHFEITETAIMDQPNRATAVLAELRAEGCRISVDDFGTGHSSLAYLADLPVDTIKIDKLFVQHLDEPWGAAVVGAAATLAHKLGLETVAEGIERQADLELCRELGVDYGQGFHIARPMYPPELQQWLSR